MEPDSRTPISVVLCFALIRIAALVVPRAEREAWKQERTAEIWHRWQFLSYAGAWGRIEALLLVRDYAVAFPEAVWRLIWRDAVRNRVRGWIRSPWTCLSGLIALLLVVAIVSSGFPATRQLLAFRSQKSSGRMLFIWRHPVIGGGDRGLPPDVVSAWAARSQLLESVAGFNITNMRLTTAQGTAAKPLVIVAERRLFETLQVRPVLGTFSNTPGVALDHRTWASLFHADPKVVGSEIRIDQQSLRVTAVLPRKFYFVTRQPAVYLVKDAMTDRRVIVLARARNGATKNNIDRELTRIAEDRYYFFRSQLRLRFLDSTVFTPLTFFGSAVLVSILMALCLCGVRIRHVRFAMSAQNRRSAARRASFFLAKLILALTILFVAGLELSRTESSLMYGSRDPGSGPFLVWLYIAGAMGVFFWTVADQRARCRECLKLLCFPVRIGCPGSLLLDWSGTELLCAEGHGVLHIPLLAPSWDEKSEHWITLDETWRDLFADAK
jgi:MacB-like protein